MRLKRRFSIMFFILVSLVFGLCVPHSAVAVAMPVGDPITFNSWKQLWEQYDVGPFNIIEAYMTSTDDYLEATVFTEEGFNAIADGWVDNSYPHGVTTTGQAYGPTIDPPNAADPMEFEIHFEGSERGNELTMDLVFWYANEDRSLEMVENTSWFYDGSGDEEGWFLTGFNMNDYVEPLGWDSLQNLVRPKGDPTGDVTEPATLLLLGAGLIGLAGFRRKFKK